MSSQDSFYLWQEELARRFPHLSGPQIRGLAQWSFGMVLAHNCGLTAVVTVLSELFKQNANTVRQRLREWYFEARAKRGKKRAQVEVESCFGPLLEWVLSLWQGTQLAIALDATNLGTRFVVLSVSVLYGGCAIPVAWAVVGAHAKGSWNAHWLRLLETIGPHVPPEIEVLVLTDRGLYSRVLFRAIREQGWHPMMRILRTATFCPEGERDFRQVTSYVPSQGSAYCARGRAFKTQVQACTLVAYWATDQEEPWLLVTDLAPEKVEAAWYALRAWIEQGFRAVKRGGWKWNTTRITDPARAARQWLTIAVATVWMLSVGTQREQEPEPWEVPAGEPIPLKLRPSQTRLRTVSLLRRGISALLAALIRHDPLPLGYLVPDPWPRFDSLTMAPVSGPP